MNEIKKGAIIAIVATFITSSMMLVTDKSVAKSSVVITVNEEQPALDVNSNSKDGRQAESNNVSSHDEKAVIRPLSDKQIPPPGPFLQETKSNVKFPGQSQKIVAPAAPKAPVGFKDRVVAPPAKPEMSLNAPMMKKPPTIGSAPISRQLNVDRMPPKAVEPNLDVSLPGTPGSPVRSATMPNESQQTPSLPASPQLNQLAPVNSAKAPSPAIKEMKPPVAPTNSTQQPRFINNDGPIWMQQNSKSAQNTNAYQTRQQQDYSGRIQSGKNIGPSGWQQYQYVPMPAHPGYQYQQQQMPIDNSGFYNAPIPNYWMPPMMPIQVPGNKMSAEQQSSSLPTNKDSN